MTPQEQPDSQAGDTTSELDELDKILVKIRREEYPGDIDEAQAAAKTAILELLAAQKQRWETAARKDELTNFEPLFKGDHSKCPDPSTCIGYQNAESDFDNEKAIRLAALDGVIGEPGDTDTLEHAADTTVTTAASTDPETGVKGSQNAPEGSRLTSKGEDNKE